MNGEKEAYCTTEEDGNEDCSVKERSIFSSDEDIDDDSAVEFLSQSTRREILAERETRALLATKVIVAMALAGVALSVCIFVYVNGRNNEEKEFRLQFEFHANRVIESFRIKTVHKFGTIESLAVTITSYANAMNATFPFVTISDWETRCSIIRNLAAVMSVWIVPIVNSNDRSSWEHYSVSNQQWLRDGLALQNFEGSRQISVESIPSEIYKVEELSPAPEDGFGPYYPVWQVAPAIPLPSIVNFNLISHPGYRDAIEVLLETKKPVIGRSFDYSNKDDKLTVGRRDMFNLILKNTEDGGAFYDDDPVSDFYYPVYDTLEGSEPNLVGFLTSIVYWKAFFTAILPENVQGIVAVLENTCNQSYSYQIDGKQVHYIGSGDRHDTDYDSLEIFSGIHNFSSKGDEGFADGNCDYKVRLFPSKRFHHSYHTDVPLTQTVSLAVAFLFTSTVFLLYDFIVERRQRIVMKKAVQSGAIVSSLFPKNVQDRLYEANDVEFQGSNGKRRRSSCLKSEASTSTVHTYSTSHRVLKRSASQRHIADFYEDCTVCFADLAGFTKWSDQRSPEDVFTLLEGLYGAFDKIASKRRVYKVETVGDCYVTVTGCPVPQGDHAAIMVKFAIECTYSMKIVLQELLHTLGGTTSDLALRVGIHSGPVMAGVLRGHQSRFQLFGDTVNTASRMECSGAPGKIHISESTANILISAGKDDWLNKRDEMVECKGKGMMQTYWVAKGCYPADSWQEEASSPISLPSMKSFSSNNSESDSHQCEDCQISLKNHFLVNTIAKAEVFIDDNARTPRRITSCEDLFLASSTSSRNKQRKRQGRRNSWDCNFQSDFLSNDITKAQASFDKEQRTSWRGSLFSVSSVSTKNQSRRHKLRKSRHRRNSRRNSSGFGEASSSSSSCFSIDKKGTGRCNISDRPRWDSSTYQNSGFDDIEADKGISRSESSIRKISRRNLNSMSGSPSRWDSMSRDSNILGRLTSHADISPGLTLSSERRNSVRRSSVG